MNLIPLYTNLDSNFRQIHFHGEFFSTVDVGIMRLFERSFQFVQLKCSESCPIAPMFLVIVVVIVIRRTTAALIISILIAIIVRWAVDALMFFFFFFFFFCLNRHKLNFQICLNKKMN